MSFLGGGGGGGGGTTNTVTRSEVPEWVKPYSERLMTRADDLSNRPYQPYGGQRVLPMNYMQQGGVEMMKDRALKGDPMLTLARQTVGGTVAGNYLDSNPYIDRAIHKSQQEAVDVYKDVLQPTLDARAVRARALGGSGYEGALGDMQEQLIDRVGDIGTETRAQLYNAERARQMASIPFAQELANEPYQAAQAMMQAGGYHQQGAQDVATAQYEDFLAQQNYPYQQLDVASAGIRGGMGGSGVTSQVGPNPYRGNPLVSGLGLGMGGAGLGSMLAPGNAAAPWYGAGIGGLLGLMYG